MSYGWTVVLGAAMILWWFAMHGLALNFVFGTSRKERIIWGIVLIALIITDMVTCAATIDANCGSGCR